MTKLKPLAFIRKQLQIKGKSLHSGRGSYYCLSNKSNVDMYNTAQEKLKHWQQQGLIESVRVDDGCKLGFVLSRNTFEGNYRYIEFVNLNNSTNKQGVDKFYCGMVVHKTLKRKEFTFGYDLEAIQDVEQYVKKNYSADEYEMFVSRGDDTMNALDISVKKGDKQLIELIKECDGSGKFRE